MASTLHELSSSHSNGRQVPAGKSHDFRAYASPDMAYASGQVTVLVQDGKPLNAVGKRLKKLAEEKLSQETNPETTHKMGIDVHGLVKASVRLSTQNKR